MNIRVENAYFKQQAFVVDAPLQRLQFRSGDLRGAVRDIEQRTFEFVQDGGMRGVARTHGGLPEQTVFIQQIPGAGTLVAEISCAPGAAFTSSARRISDRSR